MYTDKNNVIVCSQSNTFILQGVSDMRTNISGRVSKLQLPAQHCLAPLFEAIVNSIQSIQNSSLECDGRITVSILRDRANLFGRSSNKSADITVLPVRGFVITDNGEGFNARNYESFNIADSDYKAHIGGKGIGRFLWLKAFDNICVESIYEEDGIRKKRSFNFVPDGEGISDLCDTPCSEMLSTTVRLEDFKDNYAEKCPKRVTDIANRVIEHCLEYFVFEDCPTIELHDDDDTSINLNTLIEKDFILDSHQTKLDIKEKKFNVRHMRLNAMQRSQHSIYYCGNKRVVKTESLVKQIPDLHGKIKDDNEMAFVYAAYVSGDYLDSHINSERTAFTLPQTANESQADEVAWDELNREVITTTESYLKRFLDPVREAKVEKVRQYVNTEAPQYRYLLKSRQDAICNISGDLSSKSLEMELYRIHHETRIGISKEVDVLLQDANILPQEREAHRQQISEIVGKLSEVEQSDLVRYVVHRKLILNLLDKVLELGQNGKYRPESVVHSILYPMQKTSDDIENYESQNLWVIDERLSYHSYLASDRQIKTMELVGSDSSLRPDIVVFNNPLAYTDEEKPYSSITIIEFKRPMRDDMEDECNPISQVLKYVKRIQSGKQLDSKGRPLMVSATTKFFCYIIADLSESLVDQALERRLMYTPDGLGLFGYNENYNSYIEVIPFDKLLKDAKKRNRMLFDKLKLHG
jgi:hypothetical protein